MVLMEVHEVVSPRQVVRFQPPPLQPPLPRKPLEQLLDHRRRPRRMHQSDEFIFFLLAPPRRHLVEARLISLHLHLRSDAEKRFQFARASSSGPQASSSS